MPNLERRLADRVLLEMMITTQAHTPFIGGLEAEATVCPGADMGAIDG